MTSVYPVFASDDMSYKKDFISMLKNPNNVLPSTPEYEQDSLLFYSDNDIKNYLKEKIEKADIIVILIGNNTHSRKWVDYEIAVAKNLNIPIIGVRIPGSYGNLNFDLKFIAEWNVKDIQSNIGQALYYYDEDDEY